MPAAGVVDEELPELVLPRLTFAELLEVFAETKRGEPKVFVAAVPPVVDVELGRPYCSGLL
jgi:hypothetical protein